MARDFNAGEAVTANGYEFDCVGTGKKVIQIETAIEAIVVAYKDGGVASKCIAALGGGFTLQQLRWMYSSLSEAKLRMEGWSYTSVPNSDGNPSTHLWSELLVHPDCPATEIKIAGLNDDSSFSEMFREIVLPSSDEGEGFDVARPFYQNENEADLVQHLKDNDDAVSFMSYSYYAAHDRDIWAAQIQNENGDFIDPVQVSIEDGSYSPFSFWI